MDQVEIGLDAANRGDLVDHAEVGRMISDRYRG
jgi:predicted transcriptional regulator